MPVDRWAVLRVRFSGPFVLARLRDSAGEDFRAQWEGPLLWPAPAAYPLQNRIRELADGLPPFRPGPYSTGPVPLALFVDMPRFLWHEPHRIEAFLQAALLGTNADRIQIVGLAGGVKRRRPPFTLPFRLLAFGAEAHQALAAVGRHSWVQHPSVRHAGFDIDPLTFSRADVLANALRAVTRDVLVTDDIEAAVDVTRTLPVQDRPRLIIALDRRPIGMSPPLPPPGTALVAFRSLADPLPPSPSAVDSMLFGLVHDLPIHEAVKAAVRTNPVTAAVFATPWTNQSLRIRDALIALQTEVETLELSLPRVDLNALVSRLRSKGITKGITKGIVAFEKAPGANQALQDLILMQQEAVTMRSLPQNFENFEQESEGLVPMSDIADRLTQVSVNADLGAAVLKSIAADAALTALLEKHQDRVVDIALYRLDTRPLLKPLDGQNTLEAGAVYRLRVHVGNPAPESLVVGQQPPIDPLLPMPDAAGHMLEVVVQGKDFEVVGLRSQPLHLPQFGASKPVYFRVRAPRALGEASLRVHVYYFNHLVQSWMLAAETTLEEQRRDATDTLSVSLEYARIERINDVEAAQPRALSIAANDNGSGTHSLIVKGTSGAGELTLPPLTYEKEVESFLKQLGVASRDQNNPKKGQVYGSPAAGGMASPLAAKVLRGLIRNGAAIYRSLKKKAINSNPAVAVAIDDLKTSANKKVQVVRLEPNYVFPWVMLYDFNLPPDVPDAPVCLGGQLDTGDQWVSCGHTFKSGVYCVNGFWSVRHYLEELIKRQHEMQGPVTRPAKDAVRLVCAKGLAGVVDLKNAVDTAIGKPHVADGPMDEAALLDLLWSTPPERPAILIVLGHMDDTKQPGVLDSPGIVLQKGKWLTQAHLDERLSSTTWDQPRPVVMLMACDAAVMTARTINDFVSSFHTAGAAAIIGAEAVVASDLAAAFAATITKALWDKQSLGEAMVMFRRRTLAAGNPLAFLFGAIGDVDLTLQ